MYYQANNQIRVLRLKTSLCKSIAYYSIKWFVSQPIVLVGLGRQSLCLFLSLARIEKQNSESSNWSYTYLEG